MLGQANIYRADIYFEVYTLFYKIIFRRTLRLKKFQNLYKEHAKNVLRLGICREQLYIAH